MPAKIETHASTWSILVKASAEGAEVFTTVRSKIQEQLCLYVCISMYIFMSVANS